MVFRQANVSDPELATTGLGVINVIITIFAVKYMDSAGRKTLLRYSWMGMCTSYVILTSSFIFKPYLACMDQARFVHLRPCVAWHQEPTLSFPFSFPLFLSIPQVSVVSMTGVIIFFAFGPGCIAWFIIAEIFPVSARDSAMTIGIFINVRPPKTLAHWPMISPTSSWNMFALKCSGSPIGWWLFPFPFCCNLRNPLPFSFSWHRRRTFGTLPITLSRKPKA